MTSTSESLREQVEKRIAEPLVTYAELQGWYNEWYEKAFWRSDWEGFMEKKINTKAKARDEQVLTLIDEKAKELEREQRKSIKGMKTAKKNRDSSDPEYWERMYLQNNAEAYAYEVCLGLIGRLG